MRSILRARVAERGMWQFEDSPDFASRENSLFRFLWQPPSPEVREKSESRKLWEVVQGGRLLSGPSVRGARERGRVEGGERGRKKEPCPLVVG